MKTAIALSLCASLAACGGGDEPLTRAQFDAQYVCLDVDPLAVASINAPPGQYCGKRSELMEKCVLPFYPEQEMIEENLGWPIHPCGPYSTADWRSLFEGRPAE